MTESNRSLASFWICSTTMGCGSCGRVHFRKSVLFQTNPLRIATLFSRSAFRRHSEREEESRLLPCDCARLDAQKIRELRTVPRIATERIRPNDELIKQVQSALAAAEIPIAKWTGNEPAPAVRLPQTPYKQLSVRLMFEELTMRQLLQLAFQLTSEDPTLTIAQVRMTGPSDRSLEAWNVDLTLSYLLYAPQAAAPLTPGPP